MPVSVKICGLRNEATVAAAVDGGADMVGFVFFPASPRYVSPQRAGELCQKVPDGVTKVGLVVDANDDLLAEIVEKAGADMLQLHGHEIPDRVADIRERFGLPVIKVLPVYGADDLEVAKDYANVADRLMFDAKPPSGAERPGGNATAFDWRLLAGADIALPWVLAGGLTVENLAEAVKTSGAAAIDVSSGVEDAPGRKSPEKIRAFLAAAKVV